MKMSTVAFLGFLFLGIAIYLGTKMVSWGRHKAVTALDVKNTSVGKPASPSAPVASPPPAFRVTPALRDAAPRKKEPVLLFEEFRGTDSVGFLRTKAETYQLGSVSSHGLVIGIKYRMALIRGIDGTVTMVTALDSPPATQNTTQNTTQNK